MGTPGADSVLCAVWAVMGGAGTERGGTGVAVLVGGDMAMKDGAGTVTGGEVGTTTACGHKDGWHVGRPGGSIPRGAPSRPRGMATL